LRGFEAAARHLSFTRAAEELHVTQAAVSHQIKMLEEYIGVALFHRMIRKVRLTEEGSALLPVVQNAFEQISETLSDFRADDENRSLTVGLESSFSANWLSPRLGRFWAKYPGIDLRLHHSLQQAEFSYNDVDVAVRWGIGEWPNLITERLMGLQFAPVCSPGLLAKCDRLQTSSDLKHFTLLHDYDRGGWREWLKTTSTSEVNTDSGVVIDDTNVLTQAAIDGQGVALCGLALIQSHLAAGRLIKLFEHTISTRSSYYLIYHPDTIKRAHVKLFVDWLRDEILRGE
jgi:LysR family glycine cleavage system transcriptional activator